MPNFFFSSDVILANNTQISLLSFLSIWIRGVLNVRSFLSRI